MTKENNDSPQGSSWANVLMSTLAAFIGVQSDKNRQRDFQQKSIVPFMLVGTIMATLFIVGLVVIAKQLAP